MPVAFSRPFAPDSESPHSGVLCNVNSCRFPRSPGQFPSCLAVCPTVCLLLPCPVHSRETAGHAVHTAPGSLSQRAECITYMLPSHPGRRVPAPLVRAAFPQAPHCAPHCLLRPQSCPLTSIICQQSVQGSHAPCNSAASVQCPTPKPVPLSAVCPRNKSFSVSCVCHSKRPHTQVV